MKIWSEDGTGGQTLSVNDANPSRSLSVSDGTGSLSVNDGGGRKLSKSGTMTLEREASCLFASNMCVCVLKTCLKPLFKYLNICLFDDCC